MPSISKSIIVNVEAKYIEQYLNKKGFIRSEEEAVARVKVLDR